MNAYKKGIPIDAEDWHQHVEDEETRAVEEEKKQVLEQIERDVIDKVHRLEFEDPSEEKIDDDSVERFGVLLAAPGFSLSTPVRGEACLFSSPCKP